MGGTGPLAFCTQLHTDSVLKHGVGYDLIVRAVDHRLHLGIRCHTCKLVSFLPKDVIERFCGCCYRFHEDGLLAHEG